MGNQLYDLHCSINRPMRLTTLDRLLLGHYCSRFNTNLTPPIVFLGIEELSRITGMEMRSILRSRSRLAKLGLIVQITRGRPNVTSQFRVAGDLLEKMATVTEESPNLVPSVSKAIKVPQKLNLDDSSVTEQSPLSHPISIESYKSKKNRTSESRFDFIMCGIPKEKRGRISPGENLDLLLNDLEQAGKTPSAIRDYFREFSWESNSNLGGILIKRLAGFLGELNGDPSKTMQVWCGHG